METLALAAEPPPPLPLLSSPTTPPDLVWRLKINAPTVSGSMVTLYCKGRASRWEDVKLWIFTAPEKLLGTVGDVTKCSQDPRNAYDFWTAPAVCTKRFFQHFHDFFDFFVRTIFVCLFVFSAD